MARQHRIGVIHAYPNAFLVDSLHNAGFSVVIIGNGGELASHPGVEGCVEVSLWDPQEVRQAVLEWHASQPLDALIPVNEGTVVLTAQLSNELGLKALPVAAAVSSRNKLMSFLLWEAIGVATPATIPVQSAESVWRHISKYWSGRAVIKLVDSMNSQGVVAVASLDECREAVCRLTAMTKQSVEVDLKVDRNRFAYGRSSLGLIAQSYCDGIEVSAEVFLMPDGADQVLAVLEKIPAEGRYFAETASVYPANLTTAQIREVEQLALHAARGLGLKFGPAHVEIRYEQGVAKVLEAGLRPGGGYTVPLVSQLLGVNIFTCLAKIAVGLPVRWNKPSSNKAVLFGGIPYRETGTLTAVEGLEVFDDCPWLDQLVILNKAGDFVKAMPESAQPHYCYYLVSGSSRENVLSQHHAFTESVKLHISEASHDAQ